MKILKDPRTNWKYIFIVLILALLVGGGILWLTKTQEVPFTQLPELEKPEKVVKDETADWKTYRNEEYGFELKYPKNITIKKQDFSEPGSIRFAIDFGKISNNLPVRISVSNEDMIGVVRETMAITDEKEVIVDEVKGTQIIGQGQKDGSALESIILLTKNQKLYQITGSGNVFNQILSTFKFIEKDETAECSSIDIPNYEVAKEFYVDLNGDQEEEFVRVYRELTNTGTRALPIMVKVFSGTKDCPKEEFSYTGAGENEVYTAEVMQNFWGDGRNIVMVGGVSTGYGSGSSVIFRFFTYRNGGYAMIEGPQLSGHNWQCCKFDDKNALGKKIIGAESQWAPDYSDYCAGCSSRFQFFIYTWNGKEYIKTEAGTTKNKYSGCIDEILQKEPSVLEGLK